MHPWLLKAAYYNAFNNRSGRWIEGLPVARELMPAMGELWAMSAQVKILMCRAMRRFVDKLADGPDARAVVKREYASPAPRVDTPNTQCPPLLTEVNRSDTQVLSVGAVSDRTGRMNGEKNGCALLKMGPGSASARSPIAAGHA